MNNQDQNQAFDLESLQPAKIAEHNRVKTQFINTMTKIHRLSEPEAESVYERELIYYKKSLNESERLQKSTKLSLYGAFLEIAITGLSIQPGAKSEAYFEVRGTKVGKEKAGKDKEGKDIYRDIYADTARLVITAYGELNLRMRAGQIIRMCNPQVIYEGDRFQPKTNDTGDLVVEYMPAIPRKSNKIIGCYVCLVLPNNGRDFKWLLEDDIERLKKYSIPKWGTDKKPNDLYSSGAGGQIDTGFLETKTIKHAMKTLTKLRVGNNAAFEDEDEPDHPEPFAPSAGQPEQPQSTTVKIDVNEPF